MVRKSTLVEVIGDGKLAAAPAKIHAAGGSVSELSQQSRNYLCASRIAIVASLLTAPSARKPAALLELRRHGP